MALKTPEPPSWLAELRRRANLVHGISKDEEALELARQLLRLVPQLESLVQQASYSSGGNVRGQTSAIKSFVEVAAELATFMEQPAR